MASNVARSGITTNAQTGERYIPSSVRADGSKRKEIRVRPGYKPPEDVELYKNRAAAAWKNRGKGGVPGAETLSSEDDKTKVAAKSTITPTTAASNKNAKRREAKRNAKETDEAGATAEGKGAESNNWRVPAPAPKKEEKPTEEPVDLEAEKEKKARSLKKKLRQARDLRDKKQQGETLLPEQLEKVIKIQELVRQLDVLGFDSNGDKKNGESNEIP
jgi:partner of Y14 and mago protein